MQYHNNCFSPPKDSFFSGTNFFFSAKKKYCPLPKQSMVKKTSSTNNYKRYEFIGLTGLIKSTNCYHCNDYGMGCYGADTTDKTSPSRDAKDKYSEEWQTKDQSDGQKDRYHYTLGLHCQSGKC